MDFDKTTLFMQGQQSVELKDGAYVVESPLQDLGKARKLRESKRSGTLQTEYLNQDINIAENKKRELKDKPRKRSILLKSPGHNLNKTEWFE